MKEKERVLPQHALQKKIWLLFEHPESSRAARMVAITSIFIILLSIVIFCLETVPNFTQKEVINETINETIIGTNDIQNPFFLIETICIIWFTFEFVVRCVESICESMNNSIC